MTGRIRISRIRAIAPLKKSGYEEALMSAGKLVAGGEFLRISREDYERIGAQFATEISPAKSVPPGTGLGDLVHKLAGPIGRAVKFPCMKGDGSTELKPGSPCAKARALGNKLVPSIPFLS